MEGLYKKVIDLLGEPSNGDAFKRFIQEIKQTPVSESSGGDEVSFLFPELGISLETWKGALGAVHIHLITANTKDRGGTFDKYKGMLAAGVTPRDNRALVEKKLGIKPSSSRKIPGDSGNPPDLRDSYDLAPFRLSFTFDGSTGQMCFASVSNADFGKVD